MSKCKPERYVGKCGPMPAQGCTVRYTAGHGLTRIGATGEEVYKSNFWAYSGFISFFEPYITNLITMFDINDDAKKQYIMQVNISVWMDKNGKNDE